MEIPIIQIGNSKGIRLSKTIIEKYHLSNHVELILEEDRIIILPIEDKVEVNPRKDWREQFRNMSEEGGDELLMPDVLDDESILEW